MNKNYIVWKIVFAAMTTTLVFPHNSRAGGCGPGGAGFLCQSPQRGTYWTDQQRALVEQRGFGGFWIAMGEREREMFPNFYRAGRWGMESVVAPAMGVAFGPWMQRNFWTPLEQTPPNIDVFPNVPGEGYLIAPAAGTVGRWGKWMGRFLGYFRTPLERAAYGGRHMDLDFPGDILGQGSAGTVYRAHLGETPVAVKVYTAHNDPAVRAGRGISTEQFLHLEGQIIDEAMAASILSKEGLGGVKFYGTSISSN